MAEPNANYIEHCHWLLAFSHYHHTHTLTSLSGRILLSGYANGDRVTETRVRGIFWKLSSGLRCVLIVDNGATVTESVRKGTRSIVLTRVASHLARSDTSSITCIMAVTPQHTSPTNGKDPRDPLASARWPAAGLSSCEVKFHAY